jgi:hypothetical protein
LFLSFTVGNPSIPTRAVIGNPDAMRTSQLVSNPIAGDTYRRRGVGEARAPAKAAGRRAAGPHQ